MVMVDAGADGSCGAGAGLDVTAAVEGCSEEPCGLFVELPSCGCDCESFASLFSRIYLHELISRHSHSLARYRCGKTRQSLFGDLE